MDRQLRREMRRLLSLIRTQTQWAMSQGTPYLLVRAYLDNVREAAIQNPRLQRRAS